MLAVLKYSSSTKNQKKPSSINCYTLAVLSIRDDFCWYSADSGSFKCWLITTPQMVINSSCLTNEKELAIPGQTATGKELSNMLMAGSFPKTTFPTKLSIFIPTEPSTSKPHKKHKPKKQQTQAPKVPSPEPSPEHMLPLPSNVPLPDERIKKLEDRVDRLEEENMVLKELHSVHSKVDTTAPVVEREKSFKQDVNDEEPAKVEEVLEVVTAAKLITKVVTTVGATTITKTTKVSVPRRRTGLFIQDLEETTSTVVVHSEVQSKDKGKGILIEEPKLLKGQAHIEQNEAFLRQLEAELNAYINWNAVIKQVKKSERLNDAVMSTLLKNFNKEDLESLWKLVKERFEKTEQKNYTDEYLLKTLKIMFEQPDVEASVWRDQKGRYGLAKRYPLTHFTLEQMLNSVRLEVGEESEMSLELLRLVRRQLNEGGGLLGIIDFNILLMLFILSAATWNYCCVCGSIPKIRPECVWFGEVKLLWTSILLKNDRFHTKSYLLESLLNRDTLMASSPKFDSLLEEFSGELAHTDLIPPRINEAFYDDHVKEISSGRVIFYEFTDELIHIISPPEYDCFFFKIEPNSGDFTMDVVEDISPTREPRVHNALPTHPTLQLNLEFKLSSESIFTYVVWIFLPFLVYSVAPQYLLSLGNEDTIFDPGIFNYHFFSFRPDVSHRCGTFPRFKVLNESPMEILSSTCSPMDQ
uniref:Uncharacterized protein n=1 Tax=Tanacetum cinerariifolium TaxID=118510 RepID=A0A6L2KSS7_TANCI|nr:hypothetical protein [Tanacetum cinerariifolium]